jgi:hypothetical protein
LSRLDDSRVKVLNICKQEREREKESLSILKKAGGFNQERLKPANRFCFFTMDLDQALLRGVEFEHPSLEPD